MKILKIIIINFLLLFLCFLAIEGIAYFSFRTQVADNLRKTNRINQLNDVVKYSKAYYMNYENYSFHFKKYDKDTLSNRKPIVCIGCSYMEGSGLKEKDCLPALISKLTGRTVYKRAISANGPQIILDEFINGTYKKDLPQDTEYFIYMYIIYHLNRLYDYQTDCTYTEINSRYQLKSGELVKVKPPFFPDLYSFFSVKLFQNMLSVVLSDKEYSDYHLFLAVMQKIMEEKQKQFPNAKFVIIIYPTPEEEVSMPDFVKEKLNKLGYIIIDAKQLTDRPIGSYEYRQDDNEHPSAEAWKLIAPGLIKTLKL